MNTQAVEWNLIVNGTYQSKSPVELFLARFEAYRRLTDSVHSNAKAAEAFLLKTMTLPKDAYGFSVNREFVKTVADWDAPEILVERDQEDIRAVVYRIGYRTSQGKDSLHEISFFTKNKAGEYFYTHKYNLKAVFEMNTLTTETPIRQYGDPILGKPASPIKNFSQETTQIARQLEVLKTALKKTGGVGIAANQSAEIEDPLQIILAGVDYHDEEHVQNALKRYPKTLFPQMRTYLNPKILEEKGWLEFGEGCLSLRGSLRGIVGRPDRIKISYLDPNSGQEMTQELTGSDARVMQHEIDHIRIGKVYFDHIIKDLTSDQLTQILTLVKDNIKNRPPHNPNQDVPKALPDPSVVFTKNKSGKLEFDPVKLENSLNHYLISTIQGIQSKIQSNLEIRKNR